MAGIGVVVCNCDGEIDRTVALDELERRLGEHPQVVELVANECLCSDAGVELLRETIADRGLDGVLVAACSHDLYDITFLPVLAEQGFAHGPAANLDLRVAGCGSTDRAERTEQAVADAWSLIDTITPGEVEISPGPENHRRALVIGGGIAGIQAALDIANSGIEVVLVEREPSIGGHMIQLSETFPSLDCSQCILTPKMAEAGRHPRIRLLTCSEVQSVEGEPGRFTARVLRKPRYVADTCTSCGDCTEVCPSLVCDQFETGLRWRKAIYQPFPQAVPSIYILDPTGCMGLMPIACGKCAEACETSSINYDMAPIVEEIDVGAVVVATGYDLLSYDSVSEYGLGEIDDVINGFQFERLLSASGPTLGKVVRPSDGKVTEEVVFIQCVRSRSPATGKAYCSGICCMYTAKHTILYKHRVPDGQAYVFYMDIRAGGKGYEEFVQRAMETDGVVYLRGKVSRVYQHNGKVTVCGVDTLVGRPVEVEADLVVLATAMVPNEGHEEIARLTGLKADQHGFLTAAHDKTHPVEGSSPGFFVVGCCRGPSDIPDTVAQASGAAAKAVALLSRPSIGASFASGVAPEKGG
jgi:heterodisulfide reductase subunit A